MSHYGLLSKNLYVSFGVFFATKNTFAFAQVRKPFHFEDDVNSKSVSYWQLWRSERFDMVRSRGADISNINRKISGTSQKIIIRKGTFVENFFDTSEVGIISKIRGKGLANANFERINTSVSKYWIVIVYNLSNYAFSHFISFIFEDKLEPRGWDEGDPLYPEQMKTLVEDILYKYIHKLSSLSSSTKTIYFELTNISDPEILYLLVTLATWSWC